ncbi:MAG: MTH1187 family thiamine-binding protein [Desulfonatronovibrionaceae bacterium]
MSVIAELAIFPLDKGVGVSAYVKRAVDILRESGMPCEAGPMGTCVEGAWEEVMAAVDKCFQNMHRDCDRIYMTLKVDYRRDRKNGMRSKTEAVSG